MILKWLNNYVLEFYVRPIHVLKSAKQQKIWMYSMSINLYFLFISGRAHKNTKTQVNEEKRRKLL